MTGSPDRQPVGRLRWIQIDTPDPEPLVAFWSEVLGVEVDARLGGDPPQYINLASAEPGAPQVCFQRVPESKVIKNRLLFDLLVEDVDDACAPHRRRSSSLGGIGGAWRTRRATSSA